MNPRLTLRRVNWKSSLPGLVLVALLAAFFNPPDPGVTSGDLDFVQGYGFAVSNSPPLKYQEEFRRLERQAREQGRGLWNQE